MSRAKYVEVLVEEASMEQVLKALLPRMFPSLAFEIRTFAGKANLIKNLADRLRGYSSWLPAMNGIVVVLVDRDDDDCYELKAQLDEIASPGNSIDRLTVLNRIVIEELEAWFFGDTEALVRAYPRLPSSLGRQARYRDPDAVQGGTWEALERLLQKYGYHAGGLPKTLVARQVAEHMTAGSNTSRSFQVFRDGLARHVGQPKEGS